MHFPISPCNRKPHLCRAAVNRDAPRYLFGFQLLEAASSVGAHGGSGEKTDGVQLKKQSAVFWKMPRSKDQTNMHALIRGSSEELATRA